MAYLIRKISPQYWTQDLLEISCKEEIDAKSLIDLRADKNALSTWYVGNKTTEEVMRAVLAISSDFKTLDGVEVVFLDSNEIESAGMTIKPTNGDTKILEYVHLHRDIIDLNAGQLLEFAELMLKHICQEETEIFSAEQICLGLLYCINDGKLEFKDLNGEFKKGFANKVNKMVNKGTITFDDMDDGLKTEIQTQLELNKRKTTCPFELDCPRYCISIS